MAVYHLLSGAVWDPFPGYVKSNHHGNGTVTVTLNAPVSGACKDVMDKHDKTSDRLCCYLIIDQAPVYKPPYGFGVGQNIIHI